MEFGPPGNAFLYRSKTAKNKKLLPRSIFGNFVGVERNTRLPRIFVTEKKSIIFRRKDYFELYHGETSLPDRISRKLAQEGMEIPDEVTTEDPDIEEQLLRAFGAYIRHLCVKGKAKDTDTRLPRSFAEACKYQGWDAAIDCEYNALVRRGTWTYVKRKGWIKPWLKDNLRASFDVKLFGTLSSFIGWNRIPFNRRRFVLPSRLNTSRLILCHKRFSKAIACSSTTTHDARKAST